MASTILFFVRIFETLGSHFEGPQFSLGARDAYALAVAGFVGLALAILLPTIAFPLIWLAPIFLLESLAYATGNPSVFQKINKGNHTLVVSISAATLFNGIVWEFWNYYSSPKWMYTIPYVGFLKVFEMPILGYLGYPFFGVIVYNFTLLLFALIWGQDRAEEIAA